MLNREGIVRKKEPKRYYNQLAYEEVYAFIKNKDCELISKTYENARKKLKIKFKCAHIREMSFQKFKEGQRCTCENSSRYFKSVRDKTKSRVFNIFEKNNYKLVYCSTFKHKNNVMFVCDRGHTCEELILSLLKTEKCKICVQEDSLKRVRGSAVWNWKGGQRKLRQSISDKLGEWKRKSMINCGFKCVITGKSFDEIHHLYPVNKIISDASVKLGLDYRNRKCDYTYEESLQIALLVVEMHDHHPLGVCLRKDIHSLFHKLYGTDNTPEQFYEFKRNIELGLIKIK